MKIRAIYLGSPDFSACFLEKIINSNLPIEIVSVITQPDKPVGRKKILTPTPVKSVAQKYKIPIYETLNELNNVDFDLGIVFAYSKLVPKKLLDKPKYGFVNIHPSLLPLYRGPSPIALPIINGDEKTGVTIIKLDEMMDHGEILAQQEIEINMHSKRPELETQLTDLAFELFSKNIVKYLHEKAVLKPQKHENASYTKLLNKEMGYVEFEKFKTVNPKNIYNLYRGLYPWPGIWTKIEIDGKEKRIKVVELELINNALVIKKIQIEGKNISNYADFKVKIF